MKITQLILISLLSITAQAGLGQNATSGRAVEPVKAPGFIPAPQGSRVFFVSPKNGKKIAQKSTIQFGVEGMEVKPAGEILAKTGHHHLIIDGASIPAGEIVPADATHIHFGKGQKEVEIELAPGKHKLTLQFANGAHFSYGPLLSDTIDVIVE